MSVNRCLATMQRLVILTNKMHTTFEMKGYSDVLRTVDVVDCRVKQAWMRSPFLPAKYSSTVRLILAHLQKYANNNTLTSISLHTAKVELFF